MLVKGRGRWFGLAMALREHWQVRVMLPPAVLHGWTQWWLMQGLLCCSHCVRSPVATICWRAVTPGLLAWTGSRPKPECCSSTPCGAQSCGLTWSAYCGQCSVTRCIPAAAAQTAAVLLNQLLLLQANTMCTATYPAGHVLHEQGSWLQASSRGAALVCVRELPSPPSQNLQVRQRERCVDVHRITSCNSRVVAMQDQSASSALDGLIWSVGWYSRPRRLQQPQFTVGVRYSNY